MINLDSSEQSIVDGVLHYLYDLPYIVPEGTEPAPFHAKMYTAGEFFELPLLKKNALALLEPLLVSNAVVKEDVYLQVAKEAHEGTPTMDRGKHWLRSL